LNNIAISHGCAAAKCIIHFVINYGTVPMGSIAVACYKPRPGCEEALLELVRNHLPPLRALGLVTDRPSIIMRAANGTFVEVFEWVSQEAIAGAHKNPAVLDLWKGFEAVCWYETPSNLPEFQNMFAHFEPI
jgi:hypothetical protein